MYRSKCNTNRNWRNNLCLVNGCNNSLFDTKSNFNHNLHFNCNIEWLSRNDFTNHYCKRFTNCIYRCNRKLWNTKRRFNLCEFPHHINCFGWNILPLVNQ